MDANIIEELTQVIEGNGTIPQAQKDRMILLMLREIWRGMYGDEDGIVSRVKAVEKKVERIEPIVAVAKWAAAILGGAMLLLVWALITGQAVLILK